MSCLTPTVMREPLIDTVESSMIMTSSSKILELNLCTMKPSDVEFSSEYRLKSRFADKVHAIVSWWDCDFSELKNPVRLSTSPDEKYTHWKQVVFYLENEIHLDVDDEIHGSIASRKSLTNFRELDIKISSHINSNKMKRDQYSLYKLR
jgi:protein arginine N-methyltransferase 1